MVNIKKVTPSRSLDNYRRAVIRSDKELKSEDIFNDYSDKKDLRTTLITEQGYICAYCMGSIEDDPLKVKIEHCKSQEEFPEEKLYYNNLLLCCKGNEGQKSANQHCDTKKGAKTFNFNPSDQRNDMERLIKYSSKGEILSDDSNLDFELNDVLNLNFYILKKHREGVLKEIETALNFKKGVRTPSEIQKIIEKYERLSSQGEHKPFFGVAIFKLKKHQAYCKR